jgi:hypothetical protein
VLVQFSYPVFIVGLSTVNLLEINLNKPDYTTTIQICQQHNNKNSINYNYIKSEELIESNIEKYQDIIW